MGNREVFAPQSPTFAEFVSGKALRFDVRLRQRDSESAITLEI
jgi:hypothetical protein